MILIYQIEKEKNTK